MQRSTAAMSRGLRTLPPEVQNLLDYLALRKPRFARSAAPPGHSRALFSGRTESNTLAGLELSSRSWNRSRERGPSTHRRPSTAASSRVPLFSANMLTTSSDPAPKGRSVRIMRNEPSDAAQKLRPGQSSSIRHGRYCGSTARMMPRRMGAIDRQYAPGQPGIAQALQGAHGSGWPKAPHWLR